jgi:hypothetical protein
MIIISDKPGQLGNRLFVFANFIAYSLEKGSTIYNPAFDEYALHFKYLQHVQIPVFPAKTSFYKDKWRRPIAKIAYYIARILHKLHINNALIGCNYIDWEQRFDLETQKLPAKIQFVQGWLYRCNHYLEKHRKEIIHFFTPNEERQKSIDAFFKNITIPHDLKIGVHIRHGDYRTFEGGKYFYTTEQYASQMRKLVQLFPDKKILFIVCSNEKQDMSLFDGLQTLSGPGQFVDDMYSLAKCDYLLGPPSTYTAWASFYGNVPLRHISGDSENIQITDFKAINYL